MAHYRFESWRSATIWTVLFKEPSRYNWLLQYYLRAEGVTLSWVGTGRCLSSMDFTDADYHALADGASSSAARQMKRDGWWLAALRESANGETYACTPLAGDGRKPGASADL